MPVLFGYSFFNFTCPEFFPEGGSSLRFDLGRAMLYGMITAALEVVSIPSKLPFGEMTSTLDVGDMIKPASSMIWLLFDDTFDAHAAMPGIEPDTGCLTSLCISPITAILFFAM